MKISVLVLALSLAAVDGASRGESIRKEKRVLQSMGSMGSSGSMGSMGSTSGSSGSTGGTDPDCLALDGSVPSDCIVCNPCNKVRPPTLTLVYNPVGMNSLYQDETKASCRVDTYPANPGIIDVLGKNGNFRESWPVVPGVPFTLSGTAGGSSSFDSETRFSIPGWTGGDGADGDECFIHTSCSQPLVIGDQLGPFIIVEGNECLAPPPTPAPTIPTIPPCIEVDTSIDYCNGEPITVNFDFAGAPADNGVTPMPMIDDWIGIYPCETVIYKHAIVWQWACGALPSQCPSAATSNTIVFDSEPAYNAAGPHFWPTGPGCFKVVMLRNDGPSVPPYIPICESTSLNVIQC